MNGWHFESLQFQSGFLKACQKCFQLIKKPLLDFCQEKLLVFCNKDWIELIEDLDNALE